MSKIMDRLFDLQAVNWHTVPVAMLDEWEHEALAHDNACRCHKCAVLFARLAQKTFDQSCSCAIQGEIIQALRAILATENKL